MPVHYKGRYLPAIRKNVWRKVVQHRSSPLMESLEGCNCFFTQVRFLWFLYV